MPWYFHLALKHLFPSRKLVSLYAVLSILGVTAGVTVLIVVLSVMNGFQAEIREKVVTTTGHIRIEAPAIIYDYDPVLPALEAMEEVEAVSPYAYGMVVLQHRNVPLPVNIRGVDLKREVKIVPFDKYLIRGGIEKLDEDSALISSGLSRQINARVGSELELYTPLMLEKIKEDEVMLPRPVEVSGVFQTGWTVIDNNTVFCTLELMQELYGLGDGIHGITVKLKPEYEDQVDAVAAKINQMLYTHEDFPPGLNAFTWLDINADFLFVLQFEKVVMTFLLMIIVVVAALAITSTLFFSSVRKTREIGLIGAMGGRRSGVVLCYTLQGTIIGVVGCALGTAISFLLLHFRNDIIRTLMSLGNKEEVFIKYYQFSHVPSAIEAGDIFTVLIFSLVLATLAGFVPSLFAARLKPAEALRNE